MLIPKIDRNLTYYKVLTENENHNGIQYHTGLIKGILPFESDPTKSLVKGRIFITTQENLPFYFSFGDWIRPCWIPEDAHALIDPEGDIIRVDMAYFGDRFSFSEYFDKVFDPEKIDWDVSWCFAMFCSDFIDKWFYPDKFKWTYSEILITFCSRHFDKWFDPDKLDRYDYLYLEYYCPDKKHIWGQYVTEVNGDNL